MIQRMNETPGSRGVTQLALWPGRRWWLVLVLLLLLAGVLCITGYNYSLPYVDALGDPIYNLAGRMVVDFGTAKSLYMHQYPPGIIMLNYALLRLFHDPATPPSTIIWIVRLLAISASLGTLLMLALVGYHLIGPPAGLIAAGMWAVSPVIVQQSRLAGADNFITFFTMLAVWLVLAGTLYERDSWTTIAVYALMLAIIFKYQAILAAPVILVSPLLSFRHGLVRKEKFRLVFFNCLRFLLFSAWLLLLTPALDGFNKPPEQFESHWIRHVRFTGIPGWDVLRANFQKAIAGIAPELYLPGWLGMSLLFSSRIRVPYLPLIWLTGATIVWLFGISLFGAQNYRFAMVLTSLLILFAGMGWALWLQALRILSGRFVSPGIRSGVTAILLFAPVLLALPSLRASLDNAYDHTLPDRRNELATWADTTLAPGKFFASSENHKTLNRDWGGYAGETRFTYVGEHNLVERSLEEWRAGGVSFAIQPWYDYVTLLEDDPQGYLAGTTLLKAWPPSEAHRGPSMVVLALQAMQHSLPAAAVSWAASVCSAMTWMSLMHWLAPNCPSSFTGRQTRPPTWNTSCSITCWTQRAILSPRRMARRYQGRDAARLTGMIRRKRLSAGSFTCSCLIRFQRVSIDSSTAGIVEIRVSACSHPTALTTSR